MSFKKFRNQEYPYRQYEYHRLKLMVLEAEAAHSDEWLLVGSLFGPGHPYEPDFGFALERRGRKWYWVVTCEFGDSSGTHRKRVSFPLPEGIFNGLTWENFGQRINETAAPEPRLSTSPGWYSDCPDAREIEKLFR